jgi:transcriptional regulator with XRE-family HTH domain
MNKFEFGKMLKDLRLKKELRIRDVEKIADISNAYLSMLERGARGIPKVDMIRKLASVYGIEFRDLMEAAGYIDEYENRFKMDSELPQELKEIGIDYLVVTREMKESGLTPDDIRKVLKSARIMKTGRV